MLLQVVAEAILLSEETHTMEQSLPLDYPRLLSPHPPQAPISSIIIKMLVAQLHQPAV